MRHVGWMLNNRARAHWYGQLPVGRIRWFDDNLIVPVDKQALTW